jgi:hypothetical protein
MTVALICFRFGIAEVTFWSSYAEAVLSVSELTPCGRRCEKRHSIVECLGRERYRVTTLNEEE